MSAPSQHKELLPRMKTLADGQVGVPRSRFFDHSFYFVMSLVVALVVVYGFSRTVGAGLIRPPSPRPMVLYLHVGIFAGWVVFFIVQSALVRTGNVKLHRQVGWLGIALGVAIPIVGIATAIAMGRLRMQESRTDAAQLLAIPFFDMLAFSVAFALAVYWRKKPEFHRRLMSIATCSLTAAAFGRFPTALMPRHWFYAGVDALILLGPVRDLLPTKRVHPVYLFGLPILAAGQTGIFMYVGPAQVWMRVAHAILG